MDKQNNHKQNNNNNNIRMTSKAAQAALAPILVHESPTKAATTTTSGTLMATATTPIAANGNGHGNNNNDENGHGNNNNNNDQHNQQQLLDQFDHDLLAINIKPTPASYTAEFRRSPQTSWRSGQSCGDSALSSDGDFTASERSLQNGPYPRRHEHGVVGGRMSQLHRNLMRAQKSRDPNKIYEILEVLGEGSMGRVCRVRKRQSAVGGSARPDFVLKQKGCCFQLFAPLLAWLVPQQFKKQDAVLSMSVDTLSTTTTSMENHNHNNNDAEQQQQDASFLQSTDQLPPMNAQQSQQSTAISAATTEASSDRTHGLIKPPAPPNNNNNNSSSSQPPVDRRASMMYRKKSSLQSLATNPHQKKKTKDVTYALKSIHLNRCTNSSLVEELKNEVEILKGLDHPHIVRAIETFDYRHRLYIVLELCLGGDLYTREPYTEAVAHGIAKSLFSAISYLHSRDIIHRDLKFENVMFVSSKSNEIKLIDFGLSQKFAADQHLHDPVGTVYTMAPELLAGDYTSQADVWSLGVICFMLLSSSMPFYGSNRVSVIKKILKGRYRFSARRWAAISTKARDFVTACLTLDPAQRPTAAQAQNDLPWLQVDFSKVVVTATTEQFKTKTGLILRRSASDIKNSKSTRQSQHRSSRGHARKGSNGHGRTSPSKTSGGSGSGGAKSSSSPKKSSPVQDHSNNTDHTTNSSVASGTSGRSTPDKNHQVIETTLPPSMAEELDQMDQIQTSILAFSGYSRLKKLALLIIAYQSTTEEIGFMRKMFEKFDEQHDGEISYSEFAAVLKQHYDYQEGELRAMFDGIDVDGTDKVHYSEFVAATLEANGVFLDEERLAEAFDRLDCDDSGDISVHDLREFLGPEVPQHYLDEVIEEVDLTGNHLISYQEFIQQWGTPDDDEVLSLARQSVTGRHLLTPAHSLVSSISSDHEQQQGGGRGGGGSGSGGEGALSTSSHHSSSSHNLTNEAEEELAPLHSEGLAPPIEEARSGSGGNVNNNYSMPLAELPTPRTNPRRVRSDAGPALGNGPIPLLPVIPGEASTSDPTPPAANAKRTVTPTAVAAASAAAATAIQQPAPSPRQQQQQQQYPSSPRRQYPPSPRQQRSLRGISGSGRPQKQSSLRGLRNVAANLTVSNSRGRGGGELVVPPNTPTRFKARGVSKTSSGSSPRPGNNNGTVNSNNTGSNNTRTTAANKKNEEALKDAMQASACFKTQKALSLRGAWI